MVLKDNDNVVDGNTTERGTGSVINIEVVIPRHSSSLSSSSLIVDLRHQHRLGEESPAQDNSEDGGDDDGSQFFFLFILNCYTSGVVWHEIVPMLTRNHPAAQRLLILMFKHSSTSNKNNQTSKNKSKANRSNKSISKILEIPRDEKTRGNKSTEPKTRQEEPGPESSSASLSPFTRQEIPIPSHCISRFVDDLFPQNGLSHNDQIFSSFLRRKREDPLTIPLYILPPSASVIDKTFEGIVISFERTMIQKQTMTAVMATFGGGYYMMKQLQPALNLARTQRALALELGNHHMAQQCLLNEAYNLLYAGQFRHSKVVLSSLESEVQSVIESQLSSWADKGDAEQTLRQCHAARIWIRRLSKLSTKLTKHRTNVLPLGSTSSRRQADSSLGARNYTSLKGGCTLPSDDVDTGGGSDGTNVIKNKDDTVLGDIKSRTVDDFYRVRIVAT
mmetsp:Transcript_28391/g.69094  ORF Transcript_28391/g.69094 Transcript_28391/m.69094 type:complete len:447 (-) Transcript_28391:165-1505(-)